MTTTKPEDETPAPKNEETLAELEAKLLITLDGEPPEIIEEELVELRGKWETDHPKPKKDKMKKPASR